MKKEIDVIIEEGLKKIVDDKINESINNIDFQTIAENIILEKFSNDLKNISFPKITKKLSYEEIIKRLDVENRYGDNILNDIIERGIEEGVQNLILNKLNKEWYEIELDEHIGNNKKKGISKVRNILSKIFK